MCDLSFVSCSVWIAGYIDRVLVSYNAWTNNTGDDYSAIAIKCVGLPCVGYSPAFFIVLLLHAVTFQYTLICLKYISRL